MGRDLLQHLLQGRVEPHVLLIGWALVLQSGQNLCWVGGVGFGLVALIAPQSSSLSPQSFLPRPSRVCRLSLDFHGACGPAPVNASSDEHSQVAWSLHLHQVRETWWLFHKITSHHQGWQWLETQIWDLTSLMLGSLGCRVEEREKDREEGLGWSHPLKEGRQDDEGWDWGAARAVCRAVWCH